MKPTPEQIVAIETQDRALIVEAGAGTGKTWVLVQRFIRLLEMHPQWSLESIIAITFTEKAAREMRTRLRKAIEDKALANPSTASWQNYRLNLDRLQVSTIHSLCARILRENSIAAEIDPLFQVLDEQEAGFVKEQAIEETISALEAENHPALELLASLRIMDLRAEMASMLEKRGTLCQLFRQLDEPEALVSCWEAGLAEMRRSLWVSQLRDNPNLSAALISLPLISIPHPDDALAGSVLLAQQGCQAFANGDLATAANRWLQIKLTGGKQANWGGKDALDGLKSALKALREAAKALEAAGALQEIGQPDEIAAQHLHLWRSLWERLELTYNKLKESQQALDFDDLELFTDRLLHQDPRPQRLQGYLDSIQHLMVDEFQDTNLVQQRIVYALAPIDRPGKLFVVGDAKQSIYRFRQAQVSIFSHTSADIQAVTGAPPVRLSTSFRTHPGLVQATNHLFDLLLRPMGEAHADFEASPGPLTAQRETHPELLTSVEMLILPSKDSNDKKISSEEARIWEAQWIAQKLIQLKESKIQIWDKAENAYRPFEFRDAAVLFRATTQLPLYEAEFKSAGLPYLTISGRGYYDRPEVQDLIALLAALANPLDDLNLAASLRSPLFSLSDETLYWLRWHTPDEKLALDPIHFRDALSQPPHTDQPELVARARLILDGLWVLSGRVDVWELLRKALDLTGYEVVLAKNDGETGRQRANVLKFLSLAREQGGVSISNFLHRLRELKAREAREGEALGREPESGAVQLMSIHAAKGLEFPVLVVADMGRQKRSGFGSPYLLHDPAFSLVCKVRDEQGDWQEPAGYSWGKWLYQRMEEAERKRLLYVACTRAADLLILSGQLGNSDTWLTETMDAWGIEPDGPEDEVLHAEHFAIRIFRPGEPEVFPEGSSDAVRKTVGFNIIPQLAQPLPPQPQPYPLAVTRLEQLLTRDDNDLPEVRPALWASQRSDTSIRAPGFLIGNIVHKTLAHWDCLTYSDTALFRLLENYARREGVHPEALTHAVRTSHWMLMNLKQHRLYETVQQAVVKYHEIPFTLSSPLGTLHGVMDLLYRNLQGDWHVLDWKTEWAPQEKIEENAQRYRLQMAVYAQAAYNHLGTMPDVGLFFLSPKAVEYSFASEVMGNTLEEIFES
jgi:ATP-dependent helicase/nuclease subunit A